MARIPLERMPPMRNPASPASLRGKAMSEDAFIVRALTLVAEAFLAPLAWFLRFLSGGLAAQMAAAGGLAAIGGMTLPVLVLPAH